MFHYVACGLDTVYLVNGYEEIDTLDGKGFQIEDIKGLHAAIGHEIISQPGGMNGDEFRFLRTELNLSRKALASLLGLSFETIKKKESGENPIGKLEDAVLRLLYAESRKETSRVKQSLEGIASIERNLSDMRFGRSSSPDSNWTVAA